MRSLSRTTIHGESLCRAYRSHVWVTQEVKGKRKMRGTEWVQSVGRNKPQWLSCVEVWGCLLLRHSTSCTD